MATSTDPTQILSLDEKNGPAEQQQHTKAKVQVDLSSMIGRIKPKPVCLDATLKQQSMSCEDIKQFVFVSDGVKRNESKASLVNVPPALSVVSSSSSTASRDIGSADSISDGFKSNQSDNDSKDAANSSPLSGNCFLHRKGESERINLKVKTQTISRNGRQTQRWYTDPVTNTLYRMTTGCIPILRDGKILFCSASRKCEWILPKGGWEKDEAMEESAIRETFEEAGVFGIIGPSLTEVTFETRKGKKRRIEFEEVQRKAKLIREAHSSSPKAVPQTDEAMNPPVAVLSKNISNSLSGIDSGKEENDPKEKATRGNVCQDQIQLKSVQLSSDGDNVSVASETSLSHAHVKMSLFPLYVTEVKETWPEQGRFRKVVDIDEAIKISASRPYFQSALKELKERNLHVSKELQPSQNHDSTSAKET